MSKYKAAINIYFTFTLQIVFVISITFTYFKTTVAVAQLLIIDNR